MKLVTCIGAVSGMSWILIGPLLVSMSAVYVFEASNSTFSGFGSLVRQFALLLSTFAFAIC